MNKDTIVHGSIVTPSVKLKGACTVLDSVVRGEITINARAVLQGVEVDGRGTFYGRVCVVKGDGWELSDSLSTVTVGLGVKLGAGVRLLGRGEIRGEMHIYALTGPLDARNFEMHVEDDVCKKCGYGPCECDAILTASTSCEGRAADRRALLAQGNDDEGSCLDD